MYYLVKVYIYFSPFLKAGQIMLMKRYSHQLEDSTEVPRAALFSSCQWLLPDRPPCSLPTDLQITPTIERRQFLYEEALVRLNYTFMGGGRGGEITLFRNLDFVQTGTEEQPLDSSLLLLCWTRACLCSIPTTAAVRRWLCNVEVAPCSNLFRIRKRKLKKTQQTELMSKCLKKENSLWGLNFL